jgi:hypothetical protein
MVPYGLVCQSPNSILPGSGIRIWSVHSHIEMEALARFFAYALTPIDLKATCVSA